MIRPAVNAVADVTHPSDTLTRGAGSSSADRVGSGTTRAALSGSLMFRAASAAPPSSVPLHKQEPTGWITTTAGRVIFNDVVPDDLGYQNITFDKKKLENLVGDCYAKLGSEVTADLLDSLRPIGAKDYIDVQSFMWVTRDLA